MAYIGLLINNADVVAACGRSTAELHVTLAHIPVETRSSLQDEIPGALMYDLDMLWAYVTPQTLSLGALERFGATLVRRAYGAGLAGLRARVVDLLDLHGVRYSKDFEPWIPHVSVGLNIPQWCWIGHGECPGYVPDAVLVHSSRAVFAGLSGVVAHHWPLGTALRDPLPVKTAHD